MDMNFQAQEYNQNALLPPPQPNQIDNSQPYIDPNYININQPQAYPYQAVNQNQNGIYFRPNDNIQASLNNGPYPNNNPIESPPNQIRYECCCGCWRIIVCIFVFLILFTILILYALSNTHLGDTEINGE